jgi:ABC-type nitrate/sulfonate/bicarbonate transport system substrate-binding protein
MASQHVVTRVALVGSVLGLFWNQNAVAADNVTFITDFGFNGRHAYYYVALEKGYYEAAGLDVKIVRGQGSSDAVKQVASGTAKAPRLCCSRGEASSLRLLISAAPLRPR